MTVRSVDPRTGEAFGDPLPTATSDEVDNAAAAAGEAFAALRNWPRARRASLLRAAAEALDAAGDELVELADRESALGRSPRLEGELARTTNQLLAFARLVEDGWYVEAIIDPGPPDVRRMLVPLGPVAVFGASNFPLAFGVAGGDTASALAAGCPVVAKAHPSNPATSARAGEVIRRALDDAGAPEGTLSVLQGAGNEVGERIVQAAEIAAVGFTGSLAGGRALADLAAARPEPIPVYAEMGSLNPLFVLPAAARARAAEIAGGYADSMTNGVGQFCTKPGLLFAPEGPDGDAVEEALVAALADRQGGPMLNARIAEAFRAGVAGLAGSGSLRVLVDGASSGDGQQCAPWLLAADLDAFLDEPALREEHFGPLGVVVRYPIHRLAEAAAALPGSLTAGVHADPEDDDLASAVLGTLRERAGRLLFNGYPTGVAVVPAMQHGGPYPATTSPGHTSVGMTAIRRFLRPVAYQDVPDQMLPPELQDANPERILRLVDWVWTDEPIAR